MKTQLQIIRVILQSILCTGNFASSESCAKTFTYFILAQKAEDSMACTGIQCSRENCLQNLISIVTRTPTSAKYIVNLHYKFKSTSSFRHLYVLTQEYTHFTYSAMISTKLRSLHIDQKVEQGLGMFMTSCNKKSLL